MKHVTEIDRLHLLRVKGHRKKNPTNDEGGQEAGYKINQSALERMREEFRNIGYEAVGQSDLYFPWGVPFANSLI
jgi:hypothetical protein